MTTRPPIRKILETAIRGHLPAARHGAFAGNARLNADLAIDSIMLLQLIVHLELEHDLRLPEEALLNRQMETVEDLEALLVTTDNTEAHL